MLSLFTFPLLHFFTPAILLTPSLPHFFTPVISFTISLFHFLTFSLHFTFSLFHFLTISLNSLLHFGTISLPTGLPIFLSNPAPAPPQPKCHTFQKSAGARARGRIVLGLERERHIVIIQWCSNGTIRFVGREPVIGVPKLRLEGEGRSQGQRQTSSCPTRLAFNLLSPPAATST